MRIIKEEMWCYNSYGEPIELKTIYYTRKRVQVCEASGKYYHDLGYKTPVVVKSQEYVLTKVARKDYKCDLCGQNIYIDDLYATSVAKYANSKFCIDCITQFQLNDIIEGKKS